MGGTVTSMYAGLPEYLNHRTDWVVHHIFESIIQNLMSKVPTRKEHPELSLMPMEEIDSDEDCDPNNDK